MGKPDRVKRDRRPNADFDSDVKFGYRPKLQFRQGTEFKNRYQYRHGDGAYPLK